MGGYTEPEAVLSESSAAVPAVPAVPVVPAVPSYLGRVKSYNLARGFGFLECPEVKAQHGRDVFMRADAVEDLTLSKIASASGPSAAVNRGEIFVSFTVEVNQAGNPEAQNVRQVKECQVPLELRQQLPEVQAPKVAPSKESKSQGKDGEDAKDKKTSKKKGKQGQLEGVRVGDCRVHIGQDAEDNWKILSAAKGRHWFFHLTDFPSCYVILECNEPTHEEKVQCAQLCRDHTKHKLSGQVKVDATQCNNVKFDRKRDVVGECDYKDEGKVEILVV